MGRQDKRERRIRQNLHDVRGDVLKAVLEAHGFACRATRLQPTPDQWARARRYPLCIVPSDLEEAYVASAPDLPHLVGVGDTPEEAATEAVRAIAEALAHLAELGQPVPAPGGEVSGLLQVRTPKSLHRALKARAATEGVSVNAVVNHLLTRALALEEAVALPRPRRARSVATSHG
jgi:antitoxin HicB